ncbi:hypothetical protein LJC53_07340, partial [Bacteroidales bacterium OttesenSCG-928-C03]|nr:hypothetical protein [Bacteroidales bacterium OttesenSCG-928-C03]
KGGLPNNTEPYADEAYRSLPTKIVVNVSPLIYAVPSTVLCGDHGVARLTLDESTVLISSNIQWYKDNVLLPAFTGKRSCIATTPGSYMAKVVISGTTYSTNTIVITKDNDATIDVPAIHSEGGLYELCGSQSFVSLKIHEDNYRPETQTYLWYKDGEPLYDETDHEIIVTSPGNYQLLLSEDNCSAFSNGRPVVNSQGNIPVPVIGANPSYEKICGENGSVLLYLANYAAYSDDAIIKWYKDGEMMQAEQKDLYFATEAGEYTVRVFEGNCSAISAPLPITISATDNIDEAVISSVTGTTLLCGNEGVIILQLTSGNYNANAIYSWYKDGVLYLSHPDYHKPTIEITDTGRYFLRVVDGSCSVLSNEIVISKSASVGLPPADYKRLPETGSVCADQGSVYLYINNSDQYPDALYVWMERDNLLSITSDPWYYAIYSGVYYALIKVGDCTIKTEPFILGGSMHEVRKPIITPVIGDDTICGGHGVVALKLQNTANFPAITDYQWFKDDLPIPGATTPVYVAREAGIYRLQVVQANCSSVSDEYEVHLSHSGEALHKPLLTFEPGSVICEGGMTKISVSNANSFPNATYIWYRNNKQLQMGEEHTYYTDLPGTYFVQVYSDGCSSVSADSTIVTSENLILQPEMSAYPESAQICGNDGTVILRLENYNRYVTPIAFQWYKNDEILPGATRHFLLLRNATDTGNYRLRIQNGYGCVVYTDSVDVTYINYDGSLKPIIVPDTGVIYTNLPPPDNQTELTVTNVDPYASEYIWCNENHMLRRDTIATHISYIATQPDKYYVLALYDNYCMSLSDVSVVIDSVRSAPKPVISVSPESSQICDEDGVGVIEITNLSQYTNPSFKWVKVGTPDSVVSTANRLVTNIPGTYYVIVYDHETPTDSLASLPSDRVDLTLGSGSIKRPVILSSEDKICGTTGRIILYPEDHALHYSENAIYSWLRDGVEVQHGPTPTHVTSIPGEYVLQVADEGCFSESVPKTIETEVGNPLVPTIDFFGGNALQLCGENGTVILHITNMDQFDESTTTFQWYRNDLPIPGETGRFLRIDTSNNMISENDNYRVKADFGDCSTLSTKKEIPSYPYTATKPILERVPAGGELCGDDATVLLSIANISEFSGQLYYWFKDGDEVVQQGTNPTYEVTEEGTYTVYIAGSTCAAESDPESILLSSGSDITQPEISPADGNLCGGESEWLLRMTTPETQYTNPTYQWYRGKIRLSGSNKPYLATKTPGDYRLFVTDGDCSAFSAPITVPTGTGGYTYKPLISAVGDHAMCATGGR